MEDDEVIEAMTEMRGGCVAALVPAVFGAHRGSPGLRFLQSAEAAAAASPADARALCQQLGGVTHCHNARGCRHPWPCCQIRPRQPSAPAAGAARPWSAPGRVVPNRGKEVGGSGGVYSNPLGL
jgi:hypothetical protein